MRMIKWNASTTSANVNDLNEFFSDICLKNIRIYVRLFSVRTGKLFWILFFETDLFQQISLQTRQVLNIFATHKGEMCRLDSSLHESRRTLAYACVAALGEACRLNVWKRSVFFMEIKYSDLFTLYIELSVLKDVN